jgi:hypothetical protein
MKLTAYPAKCGEWEPGCTKTNFGGLHRPTFFVFNIIILISFANRNRRCRGPRLWSSVRGQAPEPQGLGVRKASRL